MKISTIATLLGCLALLGCAATPEEAARMKSKQDEARRLAELSDKEVQRVYPTMLAVCVGPMTGQPANDLVLNTAPFKKRVDNKGAHYSGTWRGEYGVSRSVYLLTASNDLCDIKGGNPESVEFQAALRKLGFGLGEYRKASLGQSAVAAGLKALIPGPTYNDVQGKQTLTHAGQNYELRYYYRRTKDYLAVLDMRVDIKPIR